MDTSGNVTCETPKCNGDAGFDTRTFIWTIDDKDNIVYVNDQWLEFADENDAPEITADSVLQRPLYSFIKGVEAIHLTKTLIEKARGGGAHNRVSFNCDSPESIRRMEMIVSPLDKGAVEFSSRVIELRIRSHLDLIDKKAKRSEDLLTICSWCNMVYILGDGWFIIDEAVKRLGLFEKNTMPHITHGICQTCLYTIYSR